MKGGVLDHKSPVFMIKGGGGGLHRVALTFPITSQLIFESWA